MSFDLTNKNISDTFQNVLQRTGSDNKLYDLEGKEVGDLRISGSLYAQEYIVTSSVTSMSIAFSSGSTQFGDSSADTHTFTGHITASGNISASGNITASGYIEGDRFYAAGAEVIRYVETGPTSFYNTTAYFSNDTIKTEIKGTLIRLNAPVTASGDISASGDLWLGKIGETHANIFNSNIKRLSLGATSYFHSNLSSSGHFYVGNSSNYFSASQGNIEISGSGTSLLEVVGDISASGDIHANHITASGRISASGTGIHRFGGITQHDRILVDDISLDDSLISDGGDLQILAGGELLLTSTEDRIRTVGSITASGDISASGNSSSSGCFIGYHITSSGNITASGDLHLTNITSSGDILFTGDTDIIAKSSASNYYDVKIGTSGISNGTRFVSGDFMHFEGVDGSSVVQFGSIQSTTDSDQFKIKVDQTYYDLVFAGGTGCDIIIQDSFKRFEVGATQTNITNSVGIGDGLSIGTYLTSSAPLTVAGNISSSGNINANDITASGNISSSGNIIGYHITASGNIHADSDIKMTDGEGIWWGDTNYFNGITAHSTLKIMNFNAGNSSKYVMQMWGSDGADYAAVRIGQQDADSTAPSHSLTVTGDISASAGIYGSTIYAGWQGSQTKIKVLPGDFVVDDDTGRPMFIEDDSTDKLFARNHGAGTLLATYPIPKGFKATGMRIYGSDTNNVVSCSVGNITSSVYMPISGGNGTIDDTITFPETGSHISSSNNNYLWVSVEVSDALDQLYGGYINIDKH